MCPFAGLVSNPTPPGQITRERTPFSVRLFLAAKFSPWTAFVQPMILFLKLNMNARKEFLNTFRTLPARLQVEEAAWYLGFAPHDIPILVRNGLLKPLGQPPANGVKYFAAAALINLRDDINWLSRASNTITRHWQSKNALKREHQSPDVLSP
jgi:hypothetical protein